MTMLTRVAVMFVAGAAVAAPVHAQSTTTAPKQTQRRTTQPPAEVPGRLRPPAGMCRVWVDNVPARQQPAPTDCARAIRNRPPNGRVIFPDEQRRSSKRPTTRPRNERQPNKPPPKPKTKPPNDPPPA